MAMLLLGGLVHSVLFPVAPVSAASSGPVPWLNALVTSAVLLVVHVSVTQFHRRLWPLVLAASQVGRGVNMILLASHTTANPTVWETVTVLPLAADGWVVMAVVCALAAGLWQGWSMVRT